MTPRYSRDNPTQHKRFNQLSACINNSQFKLMTKDLTLRVTTIYIMNEEKHNNSNVILNHKNIFLLKYLNTVESLKKFQ